MAKRETKKAKVKQTAAEHPKASSRFWRYCSILVLTGVVVLVWMSMLTFSQTDPPSQSVYPPQSPVDNAAGLVGAYISHFLRYWLGSGIYIGLLFASFASFILVLGGRIKDLTWRVVGLALLIAAGSAALYLKNPDGNGDIAALPAGILGTASGEFLLSKLAGPGAWIVVALTFCLGLVFTAENLVLQIPRFGKKVWSRRSDLPSMASIFSKLREKSPAVADARNLTASPRAVAAVPTSVAKPKPVARPALDMKEKVKELSQRLRPKPVQPRPIEKKIVKKPENKGAKNYELPTADLLADPKGGYEELQEAQALEKRAVLQQTLNDFNVAAEVVGHMTGPVITLFELSVSPGVKVANVASLSTDIARSLAVPAVRIVSPIPGKDTIGIEVPNLDKEMVRIKELMNMSPQSESQMYLPLYLGKDAGGDAIVADLGGMPHMLIAGTTGSGKSVCINAIIMSLLMTRTPEDVRLILVDPKMVEMAMFENLPHLLCPIVNDMRKAEEILEWAATKMDERYELFKEAGVRNIAGFNKLNKEEIHERFDAETDEEKARIPLHIPHYIIIIDELADLMMTSSKEVESHIIRIAQKARAVGIHLVLATQRPSVNVVTGLIKSNMPCRISFRVASRQESRIVLDQNGADVLLGQGDMLFLQPGTSNLIRSQGTFVEDSEIRTVVKKLRNAAGDPQYNVELMKLNSRPSGEIGGDKDDLFDKAVEIVLASQRGSVSLLQRRLQIGYSRASRIIDQMADSGLLGDYKGSQARECLMTLEDWQALQQSITADQSGSSALNGEPTSA